MFDSFMNKCTMCDYSTSYKDYLIRHKQRVHEGVIYKCRLCDHSTSYKANLKRHLAQKHEGVKHKCRLCDFSTSRKGDLKRHLIQKHDKGTQKWCSPAALTNPRNFIDRKLMSIVKISLVFNTRKNYWIMLVIRI
jgi:hypothetical protein